MIKMIKMIKIKSLIKKIMEKKKEEEEVTVEVCESKFKCDNCEDSGLACYKCK